MTGWASGGTSAAGGAAGSGVAHKAKLEKLAAAPAASAARSLAKGDKKRGDERRYMGRLRQRCASETFDGSFLFQSMQASPVKGSIALPFGLCGSHVPQEWTRLHHAFSCLRLRL